MGFDPERALARGRQVLQLEGEALSNLAASLPKQAFLDACQLLLNCRGRVVVTGMGKAGLVGQKISATLASTGTPSLFLHPGEALHGDLGRVRAEDLLVALSKSGETRELVALLGPARAIGTSILAICEAGDSQLGREADVVLPIGLAPEACPLGLAPTVSTTAMLAMGDALAMAVLEGRDFTREEFARFHPAGSLGKQLMRVGEIMRQGDELPLVQVGASLADTLAVMSSTPGRPGAALVVQADGSLAGIFTDGDLRRMAEAGSVPVRDAVDACMGVNPHRLHPKELLGEALRLFRDTRVDQMPVCDDDGKVVGLIDVQDLLEVRL